MKLKDAVTVRRRVGAVTCRGTGVGLNQLTTTVHKKTNKTRYREGGQKRRGER